MDFSLLGTDAWCVVGIWSDFLSRSVLRMTAKPFAQLLQRQPTRCYKLFSSLLPVCRSPSLQEWFCNDNLVLSFDVYKTAAKLGNVSFLEYLWKRQKFHQYQIKAICEKAAAHARMRVLDWLYSKLELEPAFTQALAQGACLRNRVQVLDWLEARDTDFTQVEQFRTAMIFASINDSFECLLWLWRRGVPVTIHPYTTPACQNLEMLRWLVKNHYITQRAIVENCVYKSRSSCDQGVIATLKEFIEPGVTYSTQVFVKAVMLRSLRIVQWLHQRNFPWNTGVSATAAGESTPEVMNYLLEKGCPVKPRTAMHNAVYMMNKKMITYLRARDEPFPWDERTVPRSFKRISFYQFLLEMDYPRVGWDYIFAQILSAEIDEDEEKHAQRLQDWITQNVYS